MADREADQSRWLQQFGAAVRQLRSEQGLSQEALAARCGLHRTYVGSLERGERNVGLINLLSLAAALHARPSELLILAEQQK